MIPGRLEETDINHKNTYPVPNPLCQQLGANIRKLRRRNHLTQEKLSEIVFSTQKYISRIETGYAHPSLELCLRIARALHVSLDELLRDGEGAENANGNLQEQKLYDDILAATRRYLDHRK